MKLHADQLSAQSIQAYGDGWISVNGEKITHSVVLNADGGRSPWLCERLSDIGPDHFSQLLTLNPELVIFGSGKKLHFLHPSLMAGLINRGVGVETMDTAAACRTYNVLAQEGRRVVACLLMEAPTA